MLLLVFILANKIRSYTEKIKYPLFNQPPSLDTVLWRIIKELSVPGHKSCTERTVSISSFKNAAIMALRRISIYLFL